MKRRLAFLALLTAAPALALAAGDETPAPTATPAAESEASPSPATSPVTPAPAASAVATPTPAAEASPTPSEEDRETQAPRPKPTPSFSIDGWGSTTTGNRPRMRGLLNEVEPGGWSFRWMTPQPDGDISGVMRSSLTGTFRWRKYLGDGTAFLLSARRDRAVDGSVVAAGAPFAGESPSYARFHDRVGLRVSHSFDGETLHRVSVAGHYDGESGSLGSTANGLNGATPFETNVFGAPAYRGFDRRTASLDARVEGRAAGTRFDASVAGRQDELANRYRAIEAAGPALGALAVRSGETRRSVAASIGADGSPAPALLVGGSVRGEMAKGTAETSRDMFLPSGSFQSEKIDLMATRERGTIGAAWLPLPGARVSARLEADAASFDASSIEDRSSATYTIASGHSSARPWDATGRLEGSIAPLRGLTASARLDGLVAGGSDDIRRTSLLADRSTVASLFVRDAGRSRDAESAELRLDATPLRTTRVYAGVRTERDRRHDSFDSSPLVPPTRRDLDRDTLFAGSRVRFSRLAVDGRVSLLRERIDIDGARPDRRGLDARLRATGNFRGFAAWATAALTDQRLEIPAPANATFAPVDFSSRSMVGGAGLSFTTRKLLVGASATEAVATNDLDSRLDDFSVDAALPCGRYLVGARLRHLELHDGRNPDADGTGTAGLVSLTAHF